MIIAHNINNLYSSGFVHSRLLVKYVETCSSGGGPASMYQIYIPHLGTAWRLHSQEFTADTFYGEWSLYFTVCMCCCFQTWQGMSMSCCRVVTCSLISLCTEVKTCFHIHPSVLYHSFRFKCQKINIFKHMPKKKIDVFALWAFLITHFYC